MAKENHGKHISTIQAFIAFLIAAIASGILLLFTTYKDAIVASQNFQLFMVLASIGFALLLVLLFLVNKAHHTHHTASAHHRRKNSR